MGFILFLGLCLLQTDAAPLGQQGATPTYQMCLNMTGRISITCGEEFSFMLEDGRVMELHEGKATVRGDCVIPKVPVQADCTVTRTDAVSGKRTTISTRFQPTDVMTTPTPPVSQTTQPDAVQGPKERNHTIGWTCIVAVLFSIIVLAIAACSTIKANKGDRSRSQCNRTAVTSVWQRMMVVSPQRPSPPPDLT